MLAHWHYIHHPRGTYLIRTLQRMIDEVSPPMCKPGECSVTVSILVLGRSGQRAGWMAAPVP